MKVYIFILANFDNNLVVCIYICIGTIKINFSCILLNYPYTLIIYYNCMFVYL